MKLVSKIFKRDDWYITSKFGKRNCPFHGSEFHYGVDYGTNTQKWPLYAIEDGYVHCVKKSNKGYGNYVWIRYPRINISLMYAHMDRIKCKKGDRVTAGTLIGYTGKSGNATGIHLHLGMTLIGSNKWINPHDYEYTSDNIYIVKKGDSLWKISKKCYGSGKKYKLIAEKNNIKEPYIIYPGQKLYI